MKSRDIAIVGILLAIGAILRYFLAMLHTPLTPNMVIAFYCLAGFRRARSAVVGLELKAVERGRIVAGRDHHTSGGAPVFDGERHRRSRGRFGRQDPAMIILRIEIKAI